MFNNFYNVFVCFSYFWSCVISYHSNGRKENKVINTPEVRIGCFLCKENKISSAYILGMPFFKKQMDMHYTV